MGLWNLQHFPAGGSSFYFLKFKELKEREGRRKGAGWAKPEGTSPAVGRRSSKQLLCTSLSATRRESTAKANPFLGCMQFGQDTRQPLWEMDPFCYSELCLREGACLQCEGALSVWVNWICPENYPCLKQLRYNSHNHKMHHFKVHNLVVFSIFPRFCNHHQYHPPKKPCTHDQ